MTDPSITYQGIAISETPRPSNKETPWFRYSVNIPGTGEILVETRKDAYDLIDTFLTHINLCHLDYE